MRYNSGINCLVENNADSNLKLVRLMFLLELHHSWLENIYSSLQRWEALHCLHVYGKLFNSNSQRFASLLKCKLQFSSWSRFRSRSRSSGSRSSYESAGSGSNNCSAGTLLSLDYQIFRKSSRTGYN